MYDELIKPFIVAIIGILISVGGWTTRRIFTNQKELEENRKGLALLQQKVDFQHTQAMDQIGEIKKQNEQALSVQEKILDYIVKKNL